ncbi:NAD(P)-dependent alcohol dehydrogenase [Vibrio sp. F74]|uniref:NAD(P)-dependent alcohol dehydrogenase n=1 Tax=Vibrio sp. F74 TaxID=700020 RepID=UPI0035F5968B
MEACIYKKFGRADVLEWVDNWPEPECDTDSLLIKVAASSVNPKDALLRKGKFRRTLAREPLPRLTGMDISGTVVEIGKNVTCFEIGDTVFGMTNNFSGGVLSTFAVLKETEAAKAPISIPLVTCAAIPLSAQTALQAIRDICGVEAGKKVLITGASGGVGHFAIQLSKHLGAEVHGICGTNNVDFVSTLGAHHVYDYTKVKPSEIDHQYNAVFDAAGRYERHYFSKQLKKEGIFVSTVPTGKSIMAELKARLHISNKSRLVMVNSSHEDLTYLADLVDCGKLIPCIQKTFRKDQIIEAHTQIQSGHSRGKVILSMSAR